MANPFIPLTDLRAQYTRYRDEIQSAVGTALERMDFILGKDVPLFEEAFARYIGVKHAIGCANGTDALILALRALEIGPGDEVITTPYTWISTVFAISLVGAKPVFVDIDPRSFILDPANLKKALTRRTKAVLPVHLYGQSAPMTDIMSFARKHDLYVIEDAAQAHGSLWKNQKTGTFGDIACWSFYPGKNLGAYGDAGGVATASDKLARKLRVLRNLGQETKHHHEAVAYNSRLDTLQAAILRVKLPHLDAWNDARRKAAHLYNELLSGLDVKTPWEHPDGRHIFHVYTIQVKNRDTVLKRLNQANVGAQIHYPTPVHLQPCYKQLGHRRGSFPIAEKVCRQILSLPIYPEITRDEQQTVVSALKQALG